MIFQSEKAMFITSLFIVVGVGLAQAQVRPPRCRPVSNDLVTAVRSASEPTNKRGIPSKSNCFREIREGLEASRINPANWIRNSPRWISTCRGIPFNITLPTWHIVGGTICYTPKEFRQFTYPTLRCPFTPCLGVTPTSSNERTFCRHDNYKRWRVCIYCLKGDRFVKTRYYIHTYRCCTCSRYRCLFFGPTTK